MGSLRGRWLEDGLSLEYKGPRVEYLIEISVSDTDCAYISRSKLLITTHIIGTE